MQLKTILNRVTDYKPFVFRKTSLVEESTTRQWKWRSSHKRTGLPSDRVVAERGRDTTRCANLAGSSSFRFGG
jgi:hypothetical protein